jgi:hypothetical protein
MSHNITSINTENQNIDSSTSLNLVNLITINSPTEGMMLSKSAVDWQTLGAPSEVNLKTSYFSSTLATSSSYYYNIGNNYLALKSEFLQTEGQANTTYVGAYSSNGSVPVELGNSWTMGYRPYQTFLNKRILFMMQAGPYRSANSSFTIQWGVNPSGNSNFLSWSAIGPRAYSDDVGGCYAYAVYDYTAYKSFSCQVVNKTGNNALARGRIFNIVIKVLGDI